MKLRLTEGQYERLKSVIKENADNRYNREVVVNFNYRGLPYKGGEIEEITATKSRVVFNIDVEARSWGISSAYISGIVGESEIDTTIYYYPQGQEDTVDEPIKIILDWSKLETEEVKGGGFVSVGDYLDVELAINESGAFVATKLTIQVYEL
jgi:hypothetical protein